MEPPEYAPHDGTEPLLAKLPLDAVVRRQTNGGNDGNMG